jgi:hypothetical protein
MSILGTWKITIYRACDEKLFSSLTLTFRESTMPHHRPDVGGITVKSTAIHPATGIWFQVGGTYILIFQNKPERVWVATITGDTMSGVYWTTSTPISYPGPSVSGCFRGARVATKTALDAKGKQRSNKQSVKKVSKTGAAKKS